MYAHTLWQGEQQLQLMATAARLAARALTSKMVHWIMFSDAIDTRHRPPHTGWNKPDPERYRWAMLSVIVVTHATTTARCVSNKRRPRQIIFAKISAARLDEGAKIPAPAFLCCSRQLCHFHPLARPRWCVLSMDNMAW